MSSPGRVTLTSHARFESPVSLVPVGPRTQCPESRRHGRPRTFPDAEPARHRDGDRPHDSGSGGPGRDLRAGPAAPCLALRRRPQLRAPQRPRTRGDDPAGRVAGAGRRTRTGSAGCGAVRGSRSGVRRHRDPHRGPHRAAGRRGRQLPAAGARGIRYSVRVLGDGADAGPRDHHRCPRIGQVRGSEVDGSRDQRAHRAGRTSVADPVAGDRRGKAAPSRLPRHADRVVQPACPARSPRQPPAAGPAGTRHGPVPEPRPAGRDERLPGPLRRRPVPARRVPPPGRPRRPDRLRGALRPRRAGRRARGAGTGGPGTAGRARDPAGDDRARPARRQRPLANGERGRRCGSTGARQRRHPAGPGRPGGHGREEPGRQRSRGLHRTDARRQRRAGRRRAAPADRDQQRRTHPALPAADRPDLRQAGRRGSPCAVEPPRPGFAAAERLRGHGRGHQPLRRTGPVGAGHRLRAVRGVATPAST